MHPRSIILLAFLFLLALVSHAAVINIPDDISTIQGGINIAQEGDTVLVQPGTWQELLDFQGRSITVASLLLTTGDENYIESTVIDGDSSSSVVSFLSGETEAALLCGFTITGGDGINGGAVAIIDASPQIQNVIMDANSAVSGGGLYCAGVASPTLIDVTISNNHSTGDAGGGICCENEATPLLQRVMITGNLADWDGGGIASFGQSEPQLIEATIAGNIAGHAGGGVYCENGNAVLTECEVSGNSAFLGGGIYGRDLAGLQLEYVLLSDNQVNVDGGAAYFDNATALLQHVTLIDNSAAWFGGAIFLRSATELMIGNAIILGNTAPQVFAPEFGESSVLTCGCSDIEGGQSSIETNDNCTVNWLEHNINMDPLFCDQENSDYRIQYNSPCRTIVCDYMGYTGETCEGESVPPVTRHPRGCPPPSVVLSQNYPNPFNPTTMIEFTLSYPQDIILKVYNISGQYIGILAGGSYSAGVHKVEFDGSRLTGGVYLIRLVAGEQVNTRKMVLIR